MDNTVRIFDYMKQIAKSYKDADEQLQIMSDMAKTLIHADRCTIWLHDKKTDELWNKIGDGIEGGELRIPSDTGIAGHVFTIGKPYYSNNVQNDSFYYNKVSSQTGYVTKSVLAIPMQDADDKSFGVMQLLNKKDCDGFSDEDIEIFDTITHFCELTLMNTFHEEKINAAQKDMIFLLSGIVENRSKETSNHVKRVADICKLMAKKLGMNIREITNIYLASAMHDVGKIGVPDAILNKPGKLTDEERAVMQTHATIGYNILKTFDTKLMEIAATIAHQHHEHYNGKGYPNQISGDDIDIYARIAAVADVFDALACKRCYKEPWDRDRVIKLFEEEKGEQFDPQIAQIFLDNVDEFYEILDKYPDV